MKIGIVTVHDSSNLGSYLQALAMQEIVKANGDTPYIVKPRSSFSTLCLYLGYNNARTVRSIKSFARFCMNSLRHPNRIISGFKKYLRYREDWKNLERIISVKKSNAKQFDALLLGSDEIWNMNQPAFQNPKFYGIGIHAEKKIAYAISVGNVTAETFAGHTHLLDGIKKIDHIIVRDNYTEDVLKMNGFSVDAHICDPTLQIDICKYMKSDAQVKLPEGPYMVVYSYSLEKEQIDWVKRYAKENGLRLVAVSLPQNWCDEYYNCSPLEFGAILKNATCVFTSTFHGTIFSILYHTRFVSMPIMPKVREVLILLGADDRLLMANMGYEAFAALLDTKKNFVTVDQKINSLRKESQKLYQQYVKGGQ